MDGHGLAGCANSDVPGDVGTAAPSRKLAPVGDDRCKIGATAAVLSGTHHRQPQLQLVRGRGHETLDVHGADVEDLRNLHMGQAVPDGQIQHLPLGRLHRSQRVR